MKVINYFESNIQSHWLEEIKKSNWGAGLFLYELLSNQTFFDAVGKASIVLLLVEEDKLISFCTFAEKMISNPQNLHHGWDLFIHSRNIVDIAM